MNKIIVIVILTLYSFAAQAKDGYNFTVKIDNANDTIVYLCNYFGIGKSVFKLDSARLNKVGSNTIKFKSDKKITGGIYLLLFGDRTMQQEFILDNGDEFSISFDRSAPQTTFTSKGSRENELFSEYQRYMYTRNDDYTSIMGEYGNCKDKADSAKVNERMTEFHKGLSVYRQGFAKKYAGSLSAKIFSAMQEPEVPPVPFLKDGKTKDSTFTYRYYKEHYWDGYDFKDDRLVYTPILDPKLEMYFSRLVVQTPDSFNKEADRILALCNEKTDNYKYVLWYTARHAENSKVMGMDESFLYLVEKYYMQGKAFWYHDSDIQKYRTAAEKLSNNTIGKKSQEIMLPDINERPASLHQFAAKADYTVLAFYDPTCGHCQKEIPRVDSVVRTLIKAGKKVQIFGVENAHEDVKWEAFIKEHKLDGHWLHVHDPQNVGRYRKDYNIYSNPIFYLIDKNGIIIGKRLDHHNIADFIDFYEKKLASEKKQ